MKVRLIAVACAALVLSGSALAQDVTSDKGKLSYYFGYDFGNNLSGLTARGEQLDVNAITKGMQDAFAKKQPAITVDQLRPALEAFQKREQARSEKAKAEFEKVAAENKVKSEQFLAQHRKLAGVKTLANGVQYKILDAGKGAKPTAASTVQLEVAGPYVWGQRPEPVQPPQHIPDIKISQIDMAAMRDVLTQMPLGSKWEVTLPPDSAYGADPRRPFPPNAAMQFEIKLLSIK